MAYYYKDKSTGKVWTDQDVNGASPIKEVYHFKTLQPSTSDTAYGAGEGCGHQSFYIKDGSLPFFNTGYDSNNPIEEIEYGYMPIFQVAISSISGKYNLTNAGLTTYLKPYNITPMLYKTELFKYNQGYYDNSISDVDYTSGGKLSWRMGEENLRFFNYSKHGPNQEYHTNVSAEFNLCKAFLSDNFDNNSTFGHFIKSEPLVTNTYNCNNKFDFITHSQDITPHFTLDISQIKNAGGTKVKLKMEGLYLYANNNFTSFSATPSLSNNLEEVFIQNSDSFSADISQQNYKKFCQALFYTTNNNELWQGVTDLSASLYNGDISSNLKRATNIQTDVPVVKSQQDYDISSFKYNDSFVKEKQSLDDPNVWKHMCLQYVQDTKMYTGVESETGACPNTVSAGTQHVCAKYCPFCTNGVNNQPISDIAKDQDGTRYLKCKSYTFEKARNVSLYSILNSEHLADKVKQYGSNLSGIPIPVYTAANDPYTQPYGFYMFTNDLYKLSVEQGLVCGGNGSARRIVVLANNSNWVRRNGNCPSAAYPNNIAWYECTNYSTNNVINAATAKVPCPICGDGLTHSYGDGEFSCYCMKNTKGDAIVNPHETRGQPGYIVCPICRGSGSYHPYKNHVSRFKFYGKNISTGPKSFNGYINVEGLDGVNGNTRYRNVTWTESDWKTNPPTVPQGYEGVWCSAETTEDNFVDYRTAFYGTTATVSGSAFNDFGIDSATSSKWLLYSYTANTANPSYKGLYYGHNNNLIMSRFGVNDNTNNHDYDLMYKFDTEDTFGNTIPDTTQDFNSTGYSPSAGTNYTYSRVVLTANIDLTNVNDKYLHVCYPFVTVYNATQDTARQEIQKCGIIPQMIMTYEAE